MNRRIVRGAAAALASLALLGSLRAQQPTGFELTLIDLDGKKTVLGELPASTYAPRVSPDGKRVAFETLDRTGPDGTRLWTAELSNIGARKPLPVVVGPVNWAPMWTPDGERVCSSSRAIARRRSTGGPPTEPARPSI